MFIKQSKHQCKSLMFRAPKANWELRCSSERLLASDFEALEVSWTPRHDQENLKQVSKSSKKRPGNFKEVFKSSRVTIHRVRQVIMSPQGAVGSPQRVPRSFLRAHMKVKVAQKSSTEPFESSENDLKIKNVNVHKTIEKSMKIIDF